MNRDIEQLARFQEEGNRIWEEPASFESDPGSADGNASVPSSESTVDSGESVHGAVEADGESTIPDGSENHPDIGDEVWVESETVIYSRPPDLPDLQQTTVPIRVPMRTSVYLPLIQKALERSLVPEEARSFVTESARTNPRPQGCDE